MNVLRLGFSLAGFVMALVSIALNDTRLTWGAIALLTASIIIRVIQRKRRDRSPGAGGM